MVAYYLLNEKINLCSDSVLLGTSSIVLPIHFDVHSAHMDGIQSDC